jgi:antitoxin ParD1/3/4
MVTAAAARQIRLYCAAGVSGASNFCDMTNIGIIRYSAKEDRETSCGGAMNVSLTPALEKLVQQKVESGRYRSASEVVREALRLMEEHDQIQNLHKDEIRKKIAAGMASLRAGRSVDGEAVFDRLEAELGAAERGSG